MHSEIHADMPSMLKGDPGRLRQVFGNLLSNSLKFTENGDITLSAECTGEAGNIASLVFKVTDTGIGIPEKTIKSLFEPFTQADSSTTRKYGGTGLGLAICKRIIENMGGGITIESRVNQGTTFAITVGMEKGKEKERLQYAGISGMKILVVDGNRLNRRIFREYLEESGCMAIDAANTVEALDILRYSCREKPVDVAILECL